MGFGRSLGLALVLYTLAGTMVFAQPIHDAARAGNVARVEQLLAQGVDVNVLDEAHNTALHHAVAEAQIDVVNVLLKQHSKLNINARNNAGETALHLAGYKGRQKIAALLIDHGAEINTVDNRQYTPLCAAAFEGRPETIKVLLAKGADVKGIPDDYEGNYISIPVMCALEGGKLPVVTLLLEKGAKLGPLALEPAVQRGDRDTLQFLLEKGASPDGNIMATAVAGGNRDIIDLLFDKGGVVDYQSLAYRYAAQQGAIDWNLLKVVLDKDRDGRRRAGPLLVNAVMNGAREQVETLLGMGININGQDPYGNTSLHRAAENGDLDLCRLLLAKGADINARTERGNTPLHKTVVAGHAEVVKLLVERGADVNARNEINVTPLHMAAARNQGEFVGLFLRKGAKIALRNVNDETAGQVALRYGHPELAQVLGVQPPPAPTAPPVQPAAPARSAPPPQDAQTPQITSTFSGSATLFPAHAMPAWNATIPSSPGLTLKVPLHAENGAVVPFTVAISPELRAGDQLAVLVDDQVACTVQPKGNVALTGFGGRLRVMKSGQVHALVTRRDRTQTATTAQIGVTVPATIPDRATSSGDTKVKTRQDQLLLLFNNAMARDAYIKNILIRLTEGAVEVATTPWLSKDPLIIINTPNALDGAVVTSSVYQP